MTQSKKNAQSLKDQTSIKQSSTQENSSRFVTASINNLSYSKPETITIEGVLSLYRANENEEYKLSFGNALLTRETFKSVSSAKSWAKKHTIFICGVVAAQMAKNTMETILEAEAIEYEQKAKEEQE